MRFVVDSMLGKLARWLRLSGYDVYYSNIARDEELLARAGCGGRVLLTRDSRLADRAQKLGLRAVRVKSNSIEEQLLQLGRELGLRYQRTPARALCPECNGSLEEVGRCDVAELLPEEVVEAHEEFYRCTRCGKLYWHGRHWQSIAERVVRIEGRLSTSEQ